MVNNEKLNKYVKNKKELSLREKAAILLKNNSFDYSAYNLDMNNFHYHWANGPGAKQSNIVMYENVGYDICKDNEGNPITIKGDIIGITQYLMRIPIEEYKIIQKLKLEPVKDIEMSIGRKGIRDLPEESIIGDITNTTQVIVK
jgi:hypothetical protein